MPIVTLTSDFGTDDYYLAAIKGTLLSKQPQLQLVDISHNIKPYDIVQGAYILRNAWPNFPKGSIHILSVNSFYEPEICFLALRHQGHYFIGPDNGIFTLMLDAAPELAVEVALEANNLAGLQSCFAKTVAHLSNGLPINEAGVPVEGIKEVISFRPVVTANRLQGTIVHIDHYGNAMVNIHRDLFEQSAKGRSFQLYYKRNDPITQLSSHYHDVPIGGILCWFNSTGYLEIAINSGQAASMLDLKVEDTVQVDFG